MTEASASVEVAGEPGQVRAVLADLGMWPRWLDIVVRAAPEPEIDAASNPDGNERRAWRVRLGLKVGPVPLGWDVRMELVVDEPDHLRFERRERDGRHDHSVVVIDVVVTPCPTYVRLNVALVVDKRVPFVDLQRELDRRSARTVAALQALVADQSAAGP